MHPQNYLNDLIEVFCRPLKNKADISLIKILGVREERQEAYAAKKNFFEYKRQNDVAGRGTHVGVKRSSFCY